MPIQHRNRRLRRRSTKLKSIKIKLLAILLLIGAAEAQEKLVATEHVPDAPSTRRFWSAENKIDLSIFAGQLAADAITTQRGLSEGFREVNPLIRWLQEAWLVRLRLQR